MALTPKQERFVAEYLIDLNATQAAIRAGYSEKTAYAIGHENLSKPEIQEFISKSRQKIIERAEWTAQDRIDALKALFERASKEDVKTAISAIPAIMEVNKMQGSYAPSKSELSGPDGGPIQVEQKSWRERLREERED